MCMYKLQINIMITKKRELQIKRLENELNDFDAVSSKKQKTFERSKLTHRQKILEKQSKTMRITRKYFSYDRHENQHKDTSKHDESFRTHYNRPFHLLKQYLDRKERLSYMPIIESNPEKFEDFSKGYTTMNDFRIKKSKKSIFVTADNNYKKEFPTQNKINKIDQDFINFNASKNLYQMTQQQLEQSIKWKKHFLEILNQKIRDSRVNNVRERSFR